MQINQSDTDHDSLPTNKLLAANLSLVLISYRHDIAIRSITMRKTVTKRPDNTAGVMFRNSLLLVGNY